MRSISEVVRGGIRIGFAAAALSGSALVLSGCGAETTTSPQSSLTHALATRSAEQENINRKALEITLKEWISLLNSPQKNVVFTIEDFESWQKNIRKLSSSPSIPIKDPLLVTWNAGQIYKTENGFTAMRMGGELLIQNVKILEKNVDLPEEEQNAGTSKIFTHEVNFETSYHLTGVMSSSSEDEKAVLNWLLQERKLPFLPLKGPTEDSWKVTYYVIGKRIVPIFPSFYQGQSYTGKSGGISNILYGSGLPSKTLIRAVNYDCSLSPSEPCLILPIEKV